MLSGLVIPLAIHAGFPAFSWRDFPAYMARRMIRLEPPYLISILCVIALWELSALAPGFAGGAPEWRVSQVLFHTAYLIPLTSHDWLQVVYWTLAYEFVFYIVAGLTYWAFAARSGVSWPLLVGVVLAAGLWGPLPPLALLFLTGIAVFRRLVLSDGLAATVVVIGMVAAAMTVRDMGLQGAVGAATAIAILVTAQRTFGGAAWRPLQWLGTLSYSLYLVHVPVGGRVVNLLGRVVPETPWAALAVSLTALAVSLATAALFWRWVERPAIALSRRVGVRMQARSGATQL